MVVTMPLLLNAPIIPPSTHSFRDLNTDFKQHFGLTGSDFFLLNIWF
jgi:hypothetical protein